MAVSGRVTAPDEGVVLAAVAAVPGVAHVHVDAAGELVVQVSAQSDPARVSAAVQTLLSAGLGWRPDQVAPAPRESAAQDGPLARVIPLPRRIWPGAVPSAPDLDVALDIDRAMARHPAGHLRAQPAVTGALQWTQGDAVPPDLVRLRTQGRSDAQGRPEVQISVTVRWQGQLREARQVVAATAESVRAGLVAAVLDATASAEVTVLDVHVLDLAGRDAVAVVVERTGVPVPSLGVAWVETDSRVACVMATLEALMKMDSD